MNVRCIITRLLCCAALPALPAAERVVERTFPVQPGCTLRVDSYRGSIVVEESEAPEIHVTAAIEASAETEEQAQHLLDELRLDVTAADNTVTVLARNPSASGARISWRDEEPLDIVLTISVPQRCNVDLKVLTGSLRVGNLTGRMIARTETGPISFRHIEGSVEARTDFGDVVISRCSGAVTARVLRGVIRVGPTGGFADLKNSSGDIELMTAKAGVRAETAVGDVTVGFAARNAADSHVTAAAGNVFANIAPDAVCRIDARATWGRIKNKLPLQIDAGGDGQRKLSGRLNGGTAPLITLVASGGYVTIAPAETLLE